MNRLTYDSCAYNESLAQSVNPLSYILDPVKYNNCSPCRPELGITGGNAVSHVKGNLVDLENNLRLGDRPNTHCSGYKYAPPTGPYVQGQEYIKPVSHPSVDTTMQHLKSCQFADYPGVPLAPAMKGYGCSR